MKKLSLAYLALMLLSSCATVGGAIQGFAGGMASGLKSAGSHCDTVDYGYTKTTRCTN